MLVSHQYKFIYIKTKKTASTSIQEYLKPYCGEDGIIEDKKAHRPASSIKEIVGEEVWNSYMKICPIRNPWDKMVSNYFWKRRLKNWNRFTRIFGKRWSNYNPAHYLSFTDYVKLRGEKSNIDRKILFVDDKWPEYRFIRYEHLHEDLEAICMDLNIPYEKDKLPAKKSSFRNDRQYRSHYDDESRDIVAKAFKREIEKFGYEF